MKEHDKAINDALAVLMEHLPDEAIRDAFLCEETEFAHKLDEVFGQFARERFGQFARERFGLWHNDSALGSAFAELGLSSGEDRTRALFAFLHHHIIRPQSQIDRKALIERHRGIWRIADR